MIYSKGDIVHSTAGRDIGQNYIVWQVDGKMLFLVNGRSRKIVNPKKKKCIHVAFERKSESLTKVLEEGKKVNDAYLRKILANEIKN